VILISNLVLKVLDGSAVASTEIYGKDKKTYINIGSGNVFKLHWETPGLVGETIDRYDLIIRRHDTTLNVYYDVFNKNIGLVNEFFVNSSLLSALPDQYMLSIYLVAYGKQGSVVTSNVVNPYVSKGSGTYVKVGGTDYAQPIMKRAIAFTKIALPVLADGNNQILKDKEGNTLTLTSLPDKRVRALADIGGELLADSEGNPLIAEATNVLSIVNGLTIVQNSYMQDSEGIWQQSDIKYETLVAKNTDGKFEVVTVRNNEGAYEPLYIL
jgi:hypothetical protein